MYQIFYFMFIYFFVSYFLYLSISICPFIIILFLNPKKFIKIINWITKRNFLASLPMRFFSNNHSE